VLTTPRIVATNTATTAVVATARVWLRRQKRRRSLLLILLLLLLLLHRPWRRGQGFGFEVFEARPKLWGGEVLFAAQQAYVPHPHCLPVPTVSAVNPATV